MPAPEPVTYKEINVGRLDPVTGKVYPWILKVPIATIAKPS
jgi:hypothetical protein